MGGRIKLRTIVEDSREIIKKRIAILRRRGEKREETGEGKNAT
jgi:hypothetical protein